MAERKGYDIVRLKAGHYENDAQTWDDYIDDATTALIAGHEDAAVPEGWQPIETAPRTGRKSSVVTDRLLDMTSPANLWPLDYGICQSNWRSSWGRIRK